MRSTDKDQWDLAVNVGGGHPLQLWGWGEVKARSGHWKPVRDLVTGPDGDLLGGAQVLLRRLPGPLGSLGYVPRGPFCATPAADMDSESQGSECMTRVAEAVGAHLKATTNAVSVIFEPDISAEVGFVVPGGVDKSTSVLLERTAELDLTVPEDALMAQMSKKTRQYCRKAARDGVVVKLIGEAHGGVLDDEAKSQIDTALTIYEETARRAQFALHERSYYLDVAELMGPASRIYAAYVGEEMQAFLWLVSSATVAFELYGGVTDAGQRSRANYALKWHAIQEEKGRGVQRYDMNGLLNDGVSRFKMGFVAEESLLDPGLELPLRPVRYRISAVGIPAARNVLRRLRSRV